jgi:comEA protein
MLLLRSLFRHTGKYEIELKEGKVGMSRLKIVFFVLGITMLIIIVFIQTANLRSPQDEWESVNAEMSNTLEQLQAGNESEKSDKSDQTVNSEQQVNRDTQSFKVEEPTPKSSKINLNTATLEELDLLPGIGPSKAKAIIEYRTKHGEFRSLEQITEVKGIGPRTFEKFKEMISITTES